MSEQGPHSQKERRLFFTKQDDMEMLNLVISENPFINVDKWQLICETLRARRCKNFTIKNVRGRISLLISTFRANDKKLQIASGKEEGYDEMDQLLQEASDLKKGVEENPQLKKVSRKQQTEAGKMARDLAAMTAVVVQERDLYEEIIPNREIDIPLEYDYIDPTSDDVSLSTAPPLTSSLTPKMNCSAPPIPSSAPPPLGTPVPVATPVRPPQATKRGKSSTVQQMWAKLRDDQQYKADLLQIEKMRAENDRRKLEREEKRDLYQFELESKKLKIEEDKNIILKQIVDQNAKFQEKVVAMMDTLAKRIQ